MCDALLSGKDYGSRSPWRRVFSLCLQSKELRLKILQTVNQARHPSAFNRRRHFCLRYIFIFNLPPLLARLASRVCQIQAILLGHKAMKFVECGRARISISSGKSQMGVFVRELKKLPMSNSRLLCAFLQKLAHIHINRKAECDCVVLSRDGILAHNQKD